MLVWQLPEPRLAIASTATGGGIGVRDWVLNAQVPSDYRCEDPAPDLEAIASAAGCDGPGVGFLTAADVRGWTRGDSGAVTVFATVGLRDPAWAAAAAPVTGAAPVAGTINVVAFLPERLSDAALVNTVATITEAKVQALLEGGVAGSGTPTDAVCVLTPPDGPAEPYGGPRSRLGSHLARAAHAAVTAGLA
ncbi:MAG TPA: adenosylcobinamide amidohydrolase [Acidimicrobiia bacterium]|nr:adenosylcobinamide amidohydrolase [Acidimicrobiia bacterium]